MEIICEGMQVETFVNGLRIVDFNADGILNDQMHQYDETLIRFKEIIIKEL